MPQTPLRVEFASIYDAKRPTSRPIDIDDDAYNGWVRGGDDFAVSAEFFDPSMVRDWGRPFILEHHNEDPETNRLLVIDILRNTLGERWYIISNAWRSPSMSAPAFDYYAVMLKPGSPEPCIGETILPATFLPRPATTTDDFLSVNREIVHEAAQIHIAAMNLAVSVAAALDQFLAQLPLQPDSRPIFLDDSGPEFPAENQAPGLGDQA